MTTDNDTPTAQMAPPAAPARRNAGFALCLLIAVAALLLAGWHWQSSRQQLADMAQRLSDAETVASNDRNARSQLLEQVDSLKSALTAVESRLSEFESQGGALHDQLARGREEATLLEVEQAITLAAQQLQLAGNVSVAVLALQTADSRLARLDGPAYLPLRAALAKDLARLNSLPLADVPGLSLRLEEIIVAVDKFPLVALGRPADVAPAAAPSEPKAAGSWWQQAGQEIWREVKDLVRIQRFDQTDQPLLAPGQSFFLRENLKLRLLNARLALLTRDYVTFRNELKTAQAWLTRYFAGDDKAVKAALASLQQLLASDLSVALPTLNDSHVALRELRNRKEKR
jgi:uroporphyrin-III C-methyltransferase